MRSSVRDLSVILEGPFENHYSLTVVNRPLASALASIGAPLRKHLRDAKHPRSPAPEFLCEYPDFAPRFLPTLADFKTDIHSRFSQPPYTDTMVRTVNFLHCYGWDKSSFPLDFVQRFNRDLQGVTTISENISQVLIANGVTVPVVNVGLGADHILKSPPKTVPDLPSSRFVFLHVLSCLPPKTAEVLV